MRRRAVALLTLVGVVFACSGGGPLNAFAAAKPHETLEARNVEVAERVKPSVVHIEAIAKFNDRRKQVSGSGFIASSEGHVLTNHHVIDNAEKVEVSVPGRKKKYRARIIGSDLQTDVALLRIDTDDALPAAELGSSVDVRVGQWVLAIGNPYGLDGTVSLGIVSAKGRNLEIPELINDFIQTDAMIDRGSSGGPLVDLDGRVVGINSRGQGRGIGFTIPIETALEVMQQLEGGGIERGFLGISVQPLDRDLAEYFGLPDVTGVVVNSVTEASPAERAGLRTGDILHRFDSVAIEAEQDEDLGNFQRRVASVAPGKPVEVEIFRAGERKSFEVVVGAQPNVDAAEVESDLGFHVQEITANLVRGHRLVTDRGAFVFFVASGSLGRGAGLRVGDVIERIDDQPIADLEDFRAAMESMASKERFLLTARRAEDTVFLLIKRDAPTADVENGSAAAP